MIRTCPYPILLGILYLLSFSRCSSKDDDPSVAVNPIPANSAAVKVDGVPFPVSLATTGAVVDAKTGALRVGLGSSDARGPMVFFNLSEYRGRAEKIQLSTNSGS